MAAEEKRKAQREQAFIPPVEEKPKKETKKKGEIIFSDILLVLGFYSHYGCACHVITDTFIIKFRKP